jgi:hypothetical protein
MISPVLLRFGFRSFEHFDLFRISNFVLRIKVAQCLDPRWRPFPPQIGVSWLLAHQRTDAAGSLTRSRISPASCSCPDLTAMSPMETIPTGLWS